MKIKKISSKIVQAIALISFMYAGAVSQYYLLDLIM
jgi:hypothetical protein